MHTLEKAKEIINNNLHSIINKDNSWKIIKKEFGWNDNDVTYYNYVIIDDNNDHWFFNLKEDDNGNILDDQVDILAVEPVEVITVYYRNRKI